MKTAHSVFLFFVCFVAVSSPLMAGRRHGKKHAKKKSSKTISKDHQRYQDFQDNVYLLEQKIFFWRIVKGVLAEEKKRTDAYYLARLYLEKTKVAWQKYATFKKKTLSGSQSDRLSFSFVFDKTPMTDDLQVAIFLRYCGPFLTHSLDGSFVHDQKVIRFLGSVSKEENLKAFEVARAIIFMNETNRIFRQYLLYVVQRRAFEQKFIELFVDIKKHDKQFGSTELVVLQRVQDLINTFPVLKTPDEIKQFLRQSEEEHRVYNSVCDKEIINYKEVLQDLQAQFWKKNGAETAVQRPAIHSVKAENQPCVLEKNNDCEVKKVEQLGLFSVHEKRVKKEVNQKKSQKVVMGKWDSKGLSTIEFYADRVINWFDNPEGELRLQGYNVNSKNNKHIIVCHTFPFNVAPYIEKWLTTERVPSRHKGLSELVYGIAGSITMLTSKHKEIGFFSWRVDNSGVCYHRCFSKRAPKELATELKKQIREFEFPSLQYIAKKSAIELHKGFKKNDASKDGITVTEKDLYIKAIDTKRKIKFVFFKNKKTT